MANNLKSWARENSFQMEGRAAAGMFDKWPIAVERGVGRYQAQNIICYISIQRIDDDSLFKLQSILKERKKEYGTVNASLSGENTLVLTFFSNFRQNFNTLSTRLRNVLSEAATAGIKPTDDCSVCARPTSDLVYYKKRAVHMCETCTTRTVESDHEQNKGRYGAFAVLRGILGAILGGIIGFIPYVAVMGFTNYMFAPLVLLVPAAAAYGYKILRGSSKRGVANICIYASVAVVVVLGSFFAEIAYTYIAIMAEYSVSASEVFAQIPLSMMTESLFNALFVAVETDVWMDVAFTLICGLAGMLGVHYALGDYVIPTAPIRLSSHRGSSLEMPA